MRQLLHSPLEFDRSKSQLLIDGYGPVDLMDRLREAPWLECVPSGRNFSGIALGTLALADLPDPLCPEKYRITLETVPRGDKFMVEGYQAQQAFDSIRMGIRPITFAGCPLVDDYSGDVSAYRVIIEQIS